MTSPDPRSPADVPDLTLAEFLEQRLDEVERMARAATGAAKFSTWHQGAAGDDDLVYPAGDLTDPRRCSEHPAGQPNMCDDNPVIGVDPDFVSARNAALIAAHIARHDPAWVLRDVAAKRRIVEHASAPQAWPVTSEREWDGYEAAMGTALRLLAEEFADHPDYHEEFRP